jgi:hypothetical protein
MSQPSDSFELRDSLIALPRRLLLLIAAIPLLAAGLGGYLIFSTASESVRTAAILLVTLSTSALAVGVGIAAAARVRTDDIDRLVATWLTETVHRKLSAYLEGVDSSVASSLLPPLFQRVRLFADIATSSYCLFELTDFRGEAYFMYVKSNIYNVELGTYFALATLGQPVTGTPLHLTDLTDWEMYLDDPRTRCVADTLHGAISEGYRVYISGGANADGPYVTYRLRQKLPEPFITSPYTRRYFAEDMAIAAYWLHSEIRAADSLTISGSTGPLASLPNATGGV